MTMPAHRSDRVQLLKQVQTFTLELLHCFTSVILAITLPQEPVSKKTNKQHILYIYISLVSCWRLPSLYLSHSLSHLSLSLSLSLTRLHFLNYCSSPSEPWFLTLVLVLLWYLVSIRPVETCHGTTKVPSGSFAAPGGQNGHRWPRHPSKNSCSINRTHASQHERFVNHEPPICTVS